jgi:hypothetical protein
MKGIILYSVKGHLMISLSQYLWQTAEQNGSKEACSENPRIPAGSLGAEKNLNNQCLREISDVN